jgi:hypothetical protein
MKNRLALTITPIMRQAGTAICFFGSVFPIRGVAQSGVGFVAQAAAVNVQTNMSNL